MDLLDESRLKLIIIDMHLEAEALCDKERFNLRIDDLIVREALDRAKETILYHENTKTPNHFKQCGHLCYWLIKLKPIARMDDGDCWHIFKNILDTPQALEKISQTLREYTPTPFLNKFYALFDKEFGEELDNKFARDLLNVVCNEYQAFLSEQKHQYPGVSIYNEIIALKICEKYAYEVERTDLEERIKQLSLDEEEKLIELKRRLNKLESRHSRFDKYGYDLANSFREHTYSARAVATLFEMGFASEYL